MHVSVWLLLSVRLLLVLCCCCIDANGDYDSDADDDDDNLVPHSHSETKSAVYNDVIDESDLDSEYGSEDDADDDDDDEESDDDADDNDDDEAAEIEMPTEFEFIGELIDTLLAVLQKLLAVDGSSDSESTTLLVYASNDVCILIYA